MNYNKTFAVWVLLMGLGSCNNVLRDFSDQSKDQYKIDSAKKYIDEEKFDDAINMIQPVWTRNPKDPEIGYVTSVAYAGRAGLRIITLVNELVSKLSTVGALRIFAEHFSGADDNDIADIETALTVIETVGSTPGERNSKLNFFSLFVMYSRIGVMLSARAMNGTTLRNNFTACHTVVNLGGATTGITDTDTDKVFTTLARIVEVASYVSTGADLAALIATGGIPVGVSRTGICVATPGNDVCEGVRTLVNAGKSDSGIGLGVFPGNPLPNPGGYLCLDSLTP